MTEQVTVTEELDALQSIYCKPQEFIERATSEGLKIEIRFDEISFNGCVQHCGLSFVIPPKYPSSEPSNVAVYCGAMSSKELAYLQHEVESKIVALVGTSMLLELCSFVHDYISNYADQISSDVKKGEACNSSNTTSTHDCRDSSHDKDLSGLPMEGKDNFYERCDDSRIGTFESLSSESHDIITSVLQLDHMRSKTNYIKYIKKWTAELCLKGKLVFCKKYIFIILQGRQADVKDYIIRNKSVNVDVDSKGRSCKERLLNSLCEVSAKDHIRFTEFAVIDNVPSIEDLTSLFETFSMKNLYMEYVLPCVAAHFRRLSKR